MSPLYLRLNIVATLFRPMFRTFFFCIFSIPQPRQTYSAFWLIGKGSGLSRFAFVSRKGSRSTAQALWLLIALSWTSLLIVAKASA